MSNSDQIAARLRTAAEAIRKVAQRVVNRVLNEPVVTVAVVVAALNSATEQTWEGYATAVGVALLRFYVAPVRKWIDPDYEHPGRSK